MSAINVVRGGPRQGRGLAALCVRGTDVDGRPEGLQVRGQPAMPADARTGQKERWIIVISADDLRRVGSILLDRPGSPTSAATKINTIQDIFKFPLS
ncbi:hypothetical protein [Bradyrhizobium roseum]|uniref:hypothetical protein n=1 Tax=Bradyrhizobium roseum TaxID=3056648 RepID=UPI00260E82DE|nr:hypothetical protein [Bradyrhizobium roseus]WKA25624.1 hypothetical protein QUH67_18500 [Bradyrhizobium roseus]